VHLRGDRRSRGVQRDHEGRGVARDVLQHDGVLALDRAELARLDVVQVRPRVVGLVLLDAVDKDLVDTAQPVVELEVEIAEDRAVPDGFGLDGDLRRAVVDLHREGRARLVAGLVLRADLDLRLHVVREDGGVEGRVEHVRSEELSAGVLLPLAVDHLLDLDVGPGRVGLDLRDVPGVRATDPLASGRHVDDRLGRVDREGLRRLVAERVLKDQGVDPLDRAERAGRDVVEVRPLVRSERLLDAVDDGLDHLRRVEELVAHLLVDAFGTDRPLRLDRSGRAGGVQGELDDGRVAGDVEDLEGVETLDSAEDTGGDPVEVTPGVVGEVLDDAVELDLVDLARVVQLEPDLPEGAVAADGIGLDGHRGKRVVDREREVLGRRHVAGAVERVVAQRVGAIREARQVDDELARGTACGGLGGLDDRACGVADVADDLRQGGLVDCRDDEVDVVRVEDAGRGLEGRDRLLRVDDGHDHSRVFRVGNRLVGERRARDEAARQHDSQRGDGQSQVGLAHDCLSIWWIPV